MDASLHEKVVDGVTHRWAEAGTGCPVVLVHGIPTSPRLWAARHAPGAGAQPRLGDARVREQHPGR